MPRQQPSSYEPRASELGRRGPGPGRDAPAGSWWAIAKRIKSRFRTDNLTLLAAGVAFFAFLAIFPALAAAISIYGLFGDPAVLAQQLLEASEMVPEQGRALLREQLLRLAAGSRAALGLGFVISLLVALWSANKGVKSLMQALNIVYGERETRGFFRLTGLSLLLTLGAVGVVLAVMALLVVAPALLGEIGLAGLWLAAIEWLRWPLLALFVMSALAVLYHVGPSRQAERWRWLTWGAGLATVAWLVVSGLFSMYVSGIATYNVTYGSLGAVVVFLLWLFISAVVMLLGAEVNAALEDGAKRHAAPPTPRATPEWRSRASP